MPTLSPPDVLVMNEFLTLRRSPLFIGHEKLVALLEALLRRSLSGQTSTDAVLLALVWPESLQYGPEASAEEKADLGKAARNNVRNHITRLRKKLAFYYEQSVDGLDALIVISIPHAGPTKGVFLHYCAIATFRSGLVSREEHFATGLFFRYGLPLVEGEMWFTQGVVPIGTLVISLVFKERQRRVLNSLLHEFTLAEPWPDLYKTVSAGFDYLELGAKALAANQAISDSDRTRALCAIFDALLITTNVNDAMISLVTGRVEPSDSIMMTILCQLQRIQDIWAAGGAAAPQAQEDRSLSSGVVV